MTSPAEVATTPVRAIAVAAIALRRHDLVWVSPEAWHTALITAQSDSTGVTPMLQDWVAANRPLIARRAIMSDRRGVALGLPLPPAAGKCRLRFDFSPTEVVSVKALPSLAEVAGSSPSSWRTTLSRIVDLAARFDIEVRVFGSLAWQYLTNLVYLSDGSDLDLHLGFPGPATYRGFITELLKIERAAPMRLDGEWVRADAAAVNWRELHAEPPQVLVKTLDQIKLVATADYLDGHERQ